MVLFLMLYPSPVPSTDKGLVRIEIFNPYRAHFSVESKCDWDNKKGDFSFYKRIYVKGKSHIVLSIPNHYRNCQVWPKLEKLF
jgi:hypothetical protein